MADGTEEDRKAIRHFCVLCFADDRGGSWGGGPEGGYCSNCGSGGSDIAIPAWAVESIRKNASWVGKRYYPADEDKANYEERVALRMLAGDPPGRTAEPLDDDDDGHDRWNVSQRLTDNSSISVTVKAPTMKAALEKARSILPWVSV